MKKSTIAVQLSDRLDSELDGNQAMSPNNQTSINNLPAKTTKHTNQAHIDIQVNTRYCRNTVGRYDVFDTKIELLEGLWLLHRRFTYYQHCFDITPQSFSFQKQADRRKWKAKDKGTKQENTHIERNK